MKGRTSLDDWRQVSILRVVLALILVGVSSYYLTRWSHENGMPWVLAWALPFALDVTGYQAAMVARRAANPRGRRWALTLVWLCVALSAAGNTGMHAIDFHLLTPNIWTVSATGMIFPIMLIAGHLVSGGMAPRPMRPAQIDEAAAKVAMLAAVVQTSARLAAVRSQPAARPAVKTRRPQPVVAPLLAVAPVAAAAAHRREVHVPAETAAETTREVPRVPAASGTPTRTEQMDAFILREWDRGNAVTGADVDGHVGTNPKNGLGRKRLAAMRDQYRGREPVSGNGNAAGDSGTADDYRPVNGHAVPELVGAR